MPATDKSLNCLVRSDFSWCSRAIVCVLAFIITGGAVFWMGTSKADRSKRHEATTTIQHLRMPTDGDGAYAPEEVTWPDTAAIQRQVLSDENLRHALRRLGPRARDVKPADLPATESQAIEQVRRNLRVTVKEKSSPERLRISVSYADADPDRVVRLVNALAEGYAHQQRTRLEAALDGKYLEAEQAAERARREFFSAETRFDDFLERHFLREANLAGHVAKLPAARPSAAGLPWGVSGEPASPWMTENPETAQLAGQLTALEQRRAQLLLDRTPLHPEVQDVEVRITRLKERLGSMAGEVPGRHSGVSPPSEEPVGQSHTIEGSLSTPEEADVAEILQEHAEAVRAFRDHRETLAQARQNWDRLAEAKRRAWEERLRSPDVEVELADTSEVRRPAGGSPRHLLVAIAAALAVAVGAGMISSGFGTNLPLSTPEEAETALPVPIVGRIPAVGPSSTGDCQQRSRPLGGLAKIVCGGLLIAVCFGILIAIY